MHWVCISQSIILTRLALSTRSLHPRSCSTPHRAYTAVTLGAHTYPRHLIRGNQATPICKQATLFTGRTLRNQGPLSNQATFSNQATLFTGGTNSKETLRNSCGGFRFAHTLARNNTTRSTIPAHSNQVRTLCRPSNSGTYSQRAVAANNSLRPACSTAAEVGFVRGTGRAFMASAASSAGAEGGAGAGAGAGSDSSKAKINAAVYSPPSPNKIVCFACTDRLLFLSFLS